MAIVTPRSAAFDKSALAEISDVINRTAEANSVQPVGRRGAAGTTQAYSKQRQVNFKQFKAVRTTSVLNYRRSYLLNEEPPRGKRKPMQLGPGAKVSRAADPFYQLGINPLDECMNSQLLSRFVTNMGKMRSRAETNLTWKTQRRLGKAIRRAKMMGIIPILSRRPLVSQGSGLIPLAEPDREEDQIESLNRIEY